jgi:hypothetical protein
MPEPIADDHPHAPLLDWFLQLLDTGTPTEPWRHPITIGRMRARFAIFRPSPEPRAPRDIVDRLFRPALTDLEYLFGFLYLTLDLAHKDPGFPWRILQHGDFPDLRQQLTLPWELREQIRFATGQYQPVPWERDLAAIPGHYVHLSTTRPGLIAFTANPQKGAADIQTPIKPGRYLTRFYPHLAPHEVRDIQTAIHRATDLKFAVTPEEIERVYTEGPESCMAHAADAFDSACHPVHVYGNSDLQLAYITDADDEPTARALVWPRKKRHGRIYGDQTLLAHLLKVAGYSRGDLEGARIRRIPHGSHSVVMPYLDDVLTFGVVDDIWLVVGGQHSADSTNGLADLRTLSRCERCEENVSEDDLCHVDGEHWCDSCSSDYAFRSDYSGDLFPDELSAVVITSGNANQNYSGHWTRSERDEYATYCDGSDEWYRTDRFDFVTLKNGETWVKWYFDEYGDPEDLAPETDISTDDQTVATGERVSA